MVGIKYTLPAWDDLITYDHRYEIMWKQANHYHKYQGERQFIISIQKPSEII